MRLFVITVCLFAGMSWAEAPPKAMLKLEVVLQSPEALPGSFAAKPKVMYRAGTHYCRTEEEVDPERQIHGLLIINEPDFWMVNLLAKAGKHGVDPGPTFNCRMPIFQEISGFDLEFGHELDYFKTKGVVSQPGPILQGKQTTAYKVDIRNSSVALFTYGTPERPLAIAHVHGETKDVYWYSGYGELPFDPKLFEKPAGVKIEEMTPETGH
jgi:hypothetical protein